MSINFGRLPRGTLYFALWGTWGGRGPRTGADALPATEHVPAARRARSRRGRRRFYRASMSIRSDQGLRASNIASQRLQLQLQLSLHGRLDRLHLRDRQCIANANAMREENRRRYLAISSTCRSASRALYSRFSTWTSTTSDASWTNDIQPAILSANLTLSWEICSSCIRQPGTR
ncbi:hypothetical protein F4859DRAFT_510969 [Xylaria cf. heliscus]|nr:hypothetical protein F4859DRAFT_510969 [Xylaria cf. heliscus]